MHRAGSETQQSPVRMPANVGGPPCWVDSPDGPQAAVPSPDAASCVTKMSESILQWMEIDAREECRARRLS